MNLVVKRDDDVALYRQIVGQIRERIRSGSLPPGYRLPAIRQLASECGLTRLTVHSAYAELQAQGLVDSYVGRGTFVAPQARHLAGPGGAQVPPQSWSSESVLSQILGMSERTDIVSFAQAFPAPETYPERELARCVQTAMGMRDAWSYGPVQGEAALRNQVSALLLERGLEVPPELMLVTAGAQQGIDLVLGALVDSGDVVLVEEPTYPGVLESAAHRGLKVVGVPSDEQGLRVDLLEAACQAHQPRLLYLVPTYSNPTGVTLAPERRRSILQLAQAHRLIVLEDDVYGFLSFHGQAPAPLKADDQSGQVVYLNSFSKVLAPALRVGVLVAPASLLPSLAASKQSSDLVCSSLLQRGLAEYLRRGCLPAHITGICALYRERCALMMQSLARHLPECTWQEPGGGLSVLVHLPPGVIEGEFVADAIGQGVGVAPGRAFFAHAAPGASIRLSFSMHGQEPIDQGVEVLGRVLQYHLHRRQARHSVSGRMVGPLV